MAYSVDLIYSKNQDLSDHSTETESGQPSTMELTNLESNKRYYAKAILKNDGVAEDESDIETFETLAAGTISLDFVSTVRNGDNYVVTYTVSSTYALSSAILSTNNTDFQGSISGNTIVFEVSGLTHGDAYLYTVNAIDIYAESATVSGTITTTVINEVTISDVAGNETDVTCYMTYTIESGFTEGFVEYWNENDDPSTAQPQGHSTFVDGETSCKVYDLTPGTTYQFRATIYYGGNVNHVESNVVIAKTAENQYASKYFTVTNTGSTTNTISLKTSNSSWAPVVYISTDNGSTWQDKTATTEGTALAMLDPDGSVMVKHTGAMSDVTNYCAIGATQNFTVSGNIASLCFGDDFNTGSTLTMPEAAYYGLFTANTYLVSAENLYFGDYTSVSNSGMYQMFHDCKSLTTPPDLSNITTVGNSGMYYMFLSCTSLTTPPDLSKITSVGMQGMFGMLHLCSSLATPPDLSNITNVNYISMCRMFEGCTSLTTPPDLSNITSVGDYGMQNMFYGCTRLATPPNLSKITSVGRQGMHQMFYGCTSLTTGPDLRNITSVYTDGMSWMFYNCKALTTPPYLSSITSVGGSGMYQMFYHTSLKKAYAPTIKWDTSKTNNWLYNVSPLGKLYADSSIIDSISTNDVSGCPSRWTKLSL